MQWLNSKASCRQLEDQRRKKCERSTMVHLHLFFDFLLLLLLIHSNILLFFIIYRRNNQPFEVWTHFRFCCRPWRKPFTWRPPGAWTTPCHCTQIRCGQKWRDCRNSIDASYWPYSSTRSWKLVVAGRPGILQCLSWWVSSFSTYLFVVFCFF